MAGMVSVVSPPNGLTFSQYIHDALVDTLDGGGMYAIASRSEIGGKLVSVELDTTGGAHWKFAMEITNVRGDVFPVEMDHAFQGSFSGDAMCHSALHEMLPAVRKLVHAIITHPQFSVR